MRDKDKEPIIDQGIIFNEGFFISQCARSMI